jgi:phospholipid/cholesterol/gamma-HCH transport system ATP-binding protein
MSINPEQISKQTPICAVRQVCTHYGDHAIHENVNLQIAYGDIVALIGPSGSGKTVLLRHIIGLTKPTRGEVLLFGQSLHTIERTQRQRLMRRFGMLFQHGALFSALSVFDNIALPLRELKQFDELTIYKLVMHKLSLVELEPQHGELLPAQLSGGMVKRVALARALALEPELLVLDEPTSGLDPDRSEKFIALIKQIKHTLGLTVLFTTHDPATLTALADRVAVLLEKNIITSCSLLELKTIDHPFINHFFPGYSTQPMELR